MENSNKNISAVNQNEQILIPSDKNLKNFMGYNWEASKDKHAKKAKAKMRRMRHKKEMVSILPSAVQRDALLCFRAPVYMRVDLIGEVV